VKNSYWFELAVFALIPIMAAIAGASVTERNAGSSATHKQDQAQTAAPQRTAEAPSDSRSR
jgi:ABC-type xylose transport system permease subunit